MCYVTIKSLLMLIISLLLRDHVQSLLLNLVRVFNSNGYFECIVIIFRLVKFYCEL